MMRGGVLAVVTTLLLVACQPASCKRSLQNTAATVTNAAVPASRQGSRARSALSPAEIEEKADDWYQPADATEPIWSKILRRPSRKHAGGAVDSAKHMYKRRRVPPIAMLAGLVGAAGSWAWGRASRPAAPPADIPKFVDFEEFTARARSWVRDFEPDSESSANSRLYQKILGLYEYMFEIADISGDGRLDRREQQYLDILRRYGRPVSHKVTAAMKKADDEFFYDFGFDVATDAMKQRDANRDGFVDHWEYMEGMRQFAREWYWEDSFDDQDVQAWMGATWDMVDVTRDGILDKREVHFLSLFVDKHLRSGFFADRLLKTKSIWDWDENLDGRIDGREFRKFLKES